MMYNRSSMQRMIILVSLFYSNLVFASYTKKQFLEDLLFFKKTLQEKSAYLHLSNIDLDTEIDKIKDKINRTKNYSKDLFELDLQSIQAQLINAHGRTKRWDILENQNLNLPFLISHTIVNGKNKFVAYKKNRSNFVSEKYPYIIAIEGITINMWIKKILNYIPKGTPEYELNRGLGTLRDFALSYFIMKEKFYEKKEIEVQLENIQGEIENIKMPLADKWPSYGSWPKYESHRKGDIGYLRIKSMVLETDDITEIHERMQQFKNTKGLIVDLRSNGGGTRELIYEFIPYLMRESQKYFVATLGKCRLFPECSLSSRYMYPISSNKYNEQEKSFLRFFARNFTSSINYPENKYSEWNYLLIRNKRTPQYYYNKKIVVLINKRVFSAADIFVSALKSFPQVTVLGEGTSGGSAASRKYYSPNTKMNIKLARMISFQRNGTLYDTYGIKPDIYLNEPAEYFIGKSDLSLKEAVKFLSK